MAIRLLAAKLLTRSRSTTDARAWSLRLTKKGQRTLARAEVEFARINRVLDRSLGTRNIGNLCEDLNIIIGQFEMSDDPK